MIARGVKVLAALLAAAGLSGCIAPRAYIDSALPAAGREDVKATAKPQPIQVLYEFRTRGSPNARATEFTSATVMEVFGASGLFTEVSANPAPSGRRALIIIDNVPITSHSDAMAKGFGTGLTFGLIGSMVTDGYVCDATLTSPGVEPVKLSYRHAIHSTIGNADGPPGISAQTPADAAKGVVRQLAWSILRDLSKDGRL